MTEFSESVQLVLRAKKGDKDAQYQLGIAHRDGCGVPQDLKRAVQWLSAAAKQGHPDAANELKKLDLSTKSSPQLLAIKPKSLSNQATPDDQYHLGMQYLHGEGVAQDHKEAMNWLRKAASHGHLGAKYELGLLYHEGLAGVKNDTMAYYWLNSAAKAGMKEARQEILRIWPFKARRGFLWVLGGLGAMGISLFMLPRCSPAPSSPTGTASPHPPHTGSGIGQNNPNDDKNSSSGSIG
jgi:TPR repeat protein